MTKRRDRLLVLSLVEATDVALFEELAKDWDRYFHIEHKIDRPQNIANYLTEPVGILFLDAASHAFQNEYFGIFQKNVSNFLYIAVAQSRSEHDAEIYKELADQIFYLDNLPSARKWNSLAIMRRYWIAYSKPTTIIYKDIIADFIDRKILLNNRELDLTTKEYEIIKFFIQNRGRFVQKREIFKHVWKYDADLSRSFDQMLFKVKKKMGEKYFTTQRGGEVKFE